MYRNIHLFFSFNTIKKIVYTIYITLYFKLKFDMVTKKIIKNSKSWELNTNMIITLENFESKYLDLFTYIANLFISYKTISIPDYITSRKDKLEYLTDDIIHILQECYFLLTVPPKNVKKTKLENKRTSVLKQITSTHIYLQVAKYAKQLEHKRNQAEKYQVYSLDNTTSNSEWEDTNYYDILPSDNSYIEDTFTNEENKYLIDLIKSYSWSNQEILILYNNIMKKNIHLRRKQDEQFNKWSKIEWKRRVAINYRITKEEELLKNKLVQIIKYDSKISSNFKSYILEKLS